MEDVAAQRDRLMAALRAYGEMYTEFGRVFAAWLGVHPTDAGALVEIFEAEERGEPLTPTRLSERISLSSGATTALLNRLEGAGHVVRSREHADRRVVTLRSSADLHGLADRFFGPLAVRLSAMMAEYPPELLSGFEDFLARLRTTMRAHLAEQDPSPNER